MRLSYKQIMGNRNRYIKYMNVIYTIELMVLFLFSNFLNELNHKNHLKILRGILKKAKRHKFFGLRFSKICVKNY